MEWTPSSMGKKSAQRRHEGKNQDEVSEMYRKIAKKSRKKRVIPTPLE